MGRTVAETIRDNTRVHLTQGNGLLFGQCVTAVGWIGGTVPELSESQGIVELPTSDVAGPGFAVGAALAGRRPIFVCRYQGFMWYNAATIVNYAAKSKAMWDRPCPLFVRAIGMEGQIGPVATGCHHSMIMHMPGISVIAPMTPNEWQETWDYFIQNDDPIYCSEHRLSFPLTDEMYPIWQEDSQVALFAISAGRLRAIEAVPKLADEGIQANLTHLVFLKPLGAPFMQNGPLAYGGLASPTCKFGVVIDSDYGICGAAEHAAHKLMLATNKPVYALGLADRTAGFAPQHDNLTPSSDEIVRFVKSRLRGDELPWERLL